jgi:hypothetical protein
MRRACSMHERDEACMQGLVGKPDFKRPPGTHRCLWEDDVKMNIRETGLDGVDRIHGVYLFIKVLHRMNEKPAVYGVCETERHYREVGTPVSCSRNPGLKSRSRARIFCSSSFHIPSSSLFNNHHNIWHCLISWFTCRPR